MKSINVLVAGLVGAVVLVGIYMRPKPLSPCEFLRAVRAGDAGYIERLFVAYGPSMNPMRKWGQGESENYGQQILECMTGQGRQRAFDVRVIELAIDAGLLSQRHIMRILQLKHLGIGAIAACLQVWKEEDVVTQCDSVLGALEQSRRRSAEPTRENLALAVPIGIATMSAVGCSPSSIAWAEDIVAAAIASGDVFAHLQLAVATMEWNSVANRGRGKAWNPGPFADRVAAAIEKRLAGIDVGESARSRFLLTMTLLALPGHPTERLVDEAVRTGANMLVEEGGVSGAALSECFAAWRDALLGSISAQKVFDRHMSSILEWGDSHEGAATCILLACAYTVSREVPPFVPNPAHDRRLIFKIYFGSATANQGLW
jgi:hypothetical protein